MTLTNIDRMSRQTEVISDKTKKMTVLIAGCGMNGSWAAHAVARAVKKVILYDGEDTVEGVNTGNQAFAEHHIGMPKSRALELEMIGLPVHCVEKKFPDTVKGKVDMVVSCADSFEARGNIGKWCQENGVPMIDTRAQGEQAVLCFTPPDKFDDYLMFLPRDDEVDDVQCGATGGAFTGMWIGAQVAAWINNYGRGMVLPRMLVWHVGLNHMITERRWGEDGETVVSSTVSD